MYCEKEKLRSFTRVRSRERPWSLHWIGSNKGKTKLEEGRGIQSLEVSIMMKIRNKDNNAAEWLENLDYVDVEDV